MDATQNTNNVVVECCPCRNKKKKNALSKANYWQRVIVSQQRIASFVGKAIAGVI